MGRFTLKAGAHYARPFAGWPWVGAQSIERLVTFSPECEYVLPDYHADNVNKLFGLSFGFSGVHHNSARFGWRWNQEGACIDLVAYVYRNGVRNQDAQLRFPVVAQVKPGVAYKCSVDWEGGTHEFCVTGPGVDEAFVVMVNNAMPRYGLTHSLYFGGVLSSPHDMSVQIDRT